MIFGLPVEFAASGQGKVPYFDFLKRRRCSLVIFSVAYWKIKRADWSFHPIKNSSVCAGCFFQDSRKNQPKPW